MYYCSSAEGEKLVKSVEDTMEKLKRIGPNPIKAEKISQQTS
jgi:coenzyme F420-reducing hydrogenase delta subunit